MRSGLTQNVLSHMTCSGTSHCREQCWCVGVFCSHGVLSWVCMLRDLLILNSNNNRGLAKPELTQGHGIIGVQQCWAVMMSHSRPHAKTPYIYLNVVEETPLNPARRL